MSIPAILGFLVICLLFLAHSVWREVVASREREKLYQRLQAPESATLAYAREHEGKPEPVPTLALDDDKGYEALRLRREGSVPD